MRTIGGESPEKVQRLHKYREVLLRGDTDRE